MKARYIQRGESIDYIPETDVAAGDIIVLGDLVGVAKLDIKAGELGALALVGVYEVAKDETAIAAGKQLAVNPDTGKACEPGTSGSVVFGCAVKAAEASDPTVLIRLEQAL